MSHSSVFVNVLKVPGHEKEKERKDEQANSAKYVWELWVDATGIRACRYYLSLLFSPPPPAVRQPHQHSVRPTKEYSPHVVVWEDELESHQDLTDGWLVMTPLWWCCHWMDMVFGSGTAGKWIFSSVLWQKPLNKVSSCQSRAHAHVYYRNTHLIVSYASSMYPVYPHRHNLPPATWTVLCCALLVISSCLVISQPPRVKQPLIWNS